MKSDAEKLIESQAIAEAKANKKSIAKRLTDTTIFVPEKEPVSVFMAGSPGAGKTEASIELLAQFEEEGSKILRIDPDELRREFGAYDGSNSWLFHGAVSILVEKIQDYALSNRQSFLLDGTLSSYDIAERNIKRSLSKNRSVQILYVYQEPGLAWAFVQARERQEGRNIRPDAFVQQYFASRNCVNRLKLQFGKAIKIDLLVKNHDGSHRLYTANVDQIDHHVPEKYTLAQVEKIVSET